MFSEMLFVVSGEMHEVPQQERLHPSSYSWIFPLQGLQSGIFLAVEKCALGVWRVDRWRLCIAAWKGNSNRDTSILKYHIIFILPF